MAINFVGINDLDDREKENLVELANVNYNKVKRKFENLDLILVIKKKGMYGKENKRHRYDIEVKVDAPKLIASVRKEGWEMRKLLHELFNDLMTEMEHKFKLSSKGKS